MNGEVGKNKNRAGKDMISSNTVMTVVLVIYDILACNLSYIGALWLRFDCRYSLIPDVYRAQWLRFAPFYTVLCIAVFSFLKLYRTLWRYASYKELMNIVLASMITAVGHFVGCFFFFGRMPISYWILGAVFQMFLISAIRFGHRMVYLLTVNRGVNTADYQNVMLVGGGNAGQMILRDIQTSSQIKERVVCIIDDDREKWNRYIDGVPIVGGRETILASVTKYHVDKIYLTLPRATAAQKRDILQICKESGCELKILPGMYQLISGAVVTSSLRDVAIEDLLGREPVKTDLKEVFEYLHGKVILVTGGGGSIGSELCRQIAAHQPKQLIIFDVYENNAYEIQLELREKYPALDLVVLIGSVRDSRRLDAVFAEYHPEYVYHAAAHKHVPLMEDSPCEAIKNNTIGTYKTAYAAMMHGCKRFVLVSTDKAVNPTNVMGASKRLCEMVIQTFDEKIKSGRAAELPQIFTHRDSDMIYAPEKGFRYEDIKTEFVAVRFGNVLGSNGSVVPLFKKEIAKGGPVTVTHPDIIRYFMTISEAVSLILLAGSYAHGGEIFVLDMGEPVKIDSLARNLIRLSGYTPDVDIKIEYTGLRPGEKLFEEKLMAEEGLRKTENKLIHIGEPIPFNTQHFIEQLQNLTDAAYRNDANIREIIMDSVETYHPAAPIQPMPEEKTEKEPVLVG